MSEGLTKSGDVQGVHLLGLDGVKLGVVRELFLDLAAGEIAFVIVEAGGLLGGSGKFQPVPWRVVRHDPLAGAFHAAIGKDAFKAAPGYDRDQLSKSGYGWGEQADRYFADTPSPAAIAP